VNLQLENKLALVTGSTKGIGLAISTCPKMLQVSLPAGHFGRQKLAQ
jgi:NADP-dependent 3-hydroxy acid dehydrogenase YdfG